MKYTIPVFLLITSLISCNQESKDAQQIIDNSIRAAGSNNLEDTTIEFEFRDKEYGVKYAKGTFEMVRLWGDTASGVIRDEYSNSGFKREIDGKQVEVPDSMAVKYLNSINSVIYFALLPYRLNDPAVNKTYLGQETIKEADYYKIQVTFDQEGGGKDHEDVFIYWINVENNFIDYLGYRYNTDGGGIRFREAYNPRIINGVRIVDYNNYEVPKSVAVEESAQLFVNEKLNRLSVIELENVVILKNK